MLVGGVGCTEPRDAAPQDDEAPKPGGDAAEAGTQDAGTDPVKLQYVIVERESVAVAPGESTNVPITVRLREDVEDPHYWTEANPESASAPPPSLVPQSTEQLKAERYDFSKAEEKKEPREAELAVQVPAGTEAGTYQLPVEFQYNVCSEKDGTCRPLFETFDLVVQVRPSQE
jgi:hypothetical protein